MNMLTKNPTAKKGKRKVYKDFPEPKPHSFQIREP